MDSEKDYREVALQKIIDAMKPKTIEKIVQSPELTDKFMIPGK